VELGITGLPWKHTRVQHFRVDDAHSNAYTVWLKMGSPAQVAPDDWEMLRTAGQLAELEPSQVEASRGGKLQLTFALPRQSVSLLVLTAPKHGPVKPPSSPASSALSN